MVNFCYYFGLFGFRCEWVGWVGLILLLVVGGLLTFFDCILNVRLCLLVVILWIGSGLYGCLFCCWFVWVMSFAVTGALIFIGF